MLPGRVEGQRSPCRKRGRCPAAADRVSPTPWPLAAVVLRDSVAGDAGGDGAGGDGRLGATGATVMWEGERLGAPLNLGLRRQRWEAENKCLECVLGTPDAWRGAGCGGSFRPEAQMVTGEVEVLVQRDGDEEAGGGRAVRDGCAGALQAGCA